MKTIGIICEYNPFHNGHLYHINKIKEMYKDSTIILILSGNFTQRGDVSIINKWDKTEIALNFGIDLVVELPFSYTLQSSDYFAEGAVTLLNYLKVDYLIFGSESNDIEKLTTLANTTFDSKYDDIVKKYMDMGLNYPTSLSKAIKELTDLDINTPNDILGLCYIKQIKKLNSNIIPITIKRTNDYNSNILEDNIASATSIRNAINNNIDIKKNVPELTLKYINNISCENYYNLLKYKILSEDDLSIYHNVDEGINFRIKKYILKSNTLEELINNIKTKRYTYNKIKRMLMAILCNYTKEEDKILKNITYIRILGFNTKGKNYLNSIKKELKIPIITKYMKNNPKLELEKRVTSIYASIFNNELILKEYMNKPIIK